MQLRCKDKLLDLSEPVVMGVLNVTPDSFSDGGRFFSVDAAVACAEQMVFEGAAIIDVGGESTRPGARAVSDEEEMRRVIPVIEAINDRLDVLISIDSTKSSVMRSAVAAGAHIINDVRALREEGALQSAAQSGAAVCLMHMQGASPATMQHAPRYSNVVLELKAFFAERIAVCLAAGIDRDRLCLDPGFGFGKTVDHNLQILRHLEEFTDFELPVLVGLSRKSMIGIVLGAGVAERLAGSLALATLAVWQGARIVRAHDVRATRDALRMCHAVKSAATIKTGIAF